MEHITLVQNTQQVLQQTAHLDLLVLTIAITVAASAPTLYYYCSSHSGMGGQANTPTTNSFSDFSGSVQSNVSPNSTSLVSIVTYTGNGTSGATIGHGLGAVPKMYMVKRRDTTGSWQVYHHKLDSSAPEDKYIILKLIAAYADATNRWNDTAPTSSVFSLGDSTEVNASSGTYIVYCLQRKKVLVNLALMQEMEIQTVILFI